MSLQKRNTQLIRWTRLICRLIDGRAKRLEDFEDIHEGLSRKTRLRDLRGLMLVDELEIRSYTRGNQRWWRMDGKFDATAIVEDEEKIKKRCIHCHLTKSLLEFYLCKYSPDGRKGRCAECSKKQARDYRKRNKKKVYEATMKWRRANIERHRAYQREYYAFSKGDALVGIKDKSLIPTK